MISSEPRAGTGRASLDQVLDFAWNRGVFTASDALTATSLTRSTTIDAIDTLVGTGLLRELPNARAAGEYRAGRPARRFELPADLGAVAGIDAGDTHLSVTVADLAGTVRARRRVDVDPTDSAAHRRARILSLLEATVADSGTERGELLALCAGVAAPVARGGMSPPHPEGFWERTNPGLIHALAGWAPVVEIKNDAQLAAVAEGSSGEAAGCRDYIALLAGERLGAGVVVDGHLLHGAHGGVGEMFAFDYVRGVDSALGLGPATEAHARALVDAGDVDPRGALAALAEDDLGARRVLELAGEGDPDALRVAAVLGESLAHVVGVLGSMFDPERVIVCGAVAAGIGPVLDAARDALAPLLHLPAPKLVASRLGGDIVTVGAIATALGAVRTVVLPQLAEHRLRTP